MCVVLFRSEKAQCLQFAFKQFNKIYSIKNVLSRMMHVFKNKISLAESYLPASGLDWRRERLGQGNQIGSCCSSQGKGACVSLMMDKNQSVPKIATE